MNQDFHKEFEFSKEIIKKAGEISLSYYKKNVKRIDEGNAFKSIITQADPVVEAFIRGEFTSRFPNYGFIGEESSEDNKEISWIVDPIDGTTGFFRGIPEFSNVIGLKVGKKMVFSLINVPLSNNLYSAYLQEGAYKNSEKIQVSSIPTMKKAITALGVRSFREKKFQEFSLTIAAGNHIRIINSSSIDSIYLATGRIDVIVKFEQKIWDTAPEILLMKESGAIVTDLKGHHIEFEFSKNSLTSYIATNNFLAENEKDLLYSWSLD